MSRTAPMQTSMNGGELSPFMLGRPDHEIWQVALAEMVGFAPRPQGPAEACPGFAYLGDIAGPCRLIAFEPEATQGYAIEASHQLLRFWTNDALLESGGNPVTLAAPWTHAQLADLACEQSIDVLYMFHPAVKARLLTRTAADAFTLDAADFTNGPFLDRNDDESHTLSFSGVTGSVTVTSSKALFAASDVGRLIEVEAQDTGDVPSWEPGITTAQGKLLEWDGRVYQVMGGAGMELRTGSVAPTHTRGVQWDGIGQGQDLNEKNAGGVQLLYMHDMFGRARITGYASATSVTATVTRRLPLQMSGSGGSWNTDDYFPPWWTPGYTGGGAWANPGTGSYSAGTWRWRLGAFSDTSGHPERGVVWNERLILAHRGWLYGSAAGDLLNFDRLNEFGEVSVDMGFAVPVGAMKPIRWLHAGDELFIGTDDGEWVLRAASTSQPFGPGNMKLARQTREGCAALQPVDNDGRPIFLQRNRRRVLEMVETSYGRYTTEDVTRYADHIGNSRFVEMTWQREPLQLLWAVREDGTLACADYMPEEQVLGWWRRPLADPLKARSICTITDPEGRRDQLWCAAELGGQWVMLQLAPWRQAGEWDGNAVMSDAALQYSGAPVTIVAAAHLAGREVELVANGHYIGLVTLDANGETTLPDPAQTVMLGLPFPAHIGLLPMEAGGDNGPAQGKMKRISRLMARVQGSLGLRVTIADEAGNRRTLAEIENTFPATDISAPIAPRTGDVTVDIVGQWDRAGQLRIERVAPLPSTILGFVGTVDTSQR